MNITIASARASDITTINNLLCEAFNISTQYAIETNFLNQNNLHCFVAKANEAVLGTATLFILQKTNRKVGLIEDVVVSEQARGKGVGKMLIEHIVKASTQFGCYKTILNCPEKNIPFYEKLGFKPKEVQMALRHFD